MADPSGYRDANIIGLRQLIRSRGRYSESGQNWSVQYSIADLHSPEALAPAENIRRMTASVSYNRPSKMEIGLPACCGPNQNIEGGNIGTDTCWNRRYVFIEKITWMRN